VVTSYYWFFNNFDILQWVIFYFVVGTVIAIVMDENGV
jgi:hypothetical protein